MMWRKVTRIGLVGLLVLPLSIYAVNGSANDLVKASNKAPINAADRLLPSLSTITESELTELANRIRFNETANRAEWQVFWSPREAFPSLGLGHFIWLPAEVAVPFEAGFPAMAHFVAQHYPTPQWLLAEHAPWTTRAEFLAAQQTGHDDIQELQAWLLATQTWQMAFILERFAVRAELAKARLALTDQDPRWQLFMHLMTSTAGRYALIDYSNFKGWGDLEQERYQGQGWGLFNVLEQMLATNENIMSANKNNILENFSDTSYQVLEQRVSLAPNPEERWLPGWKVRTQTYRQVM
ncbi:hypothetical protein THIAE_05255 [Thiomicrospira aerophila AL3]|uniref:Uncharacterized protein n=1 Tax=Thiomicrospira aerophila AL3 TaxID=717772 RepID=W0DWN7_9GAMM|nr:hypothetical protein [Thiomicrospira aerophila]AHF01276.1 hypothetical protein THIAE_05255 [Thiomicrospira aerophila AL3]